MVIYNKDRDRGYNTKEETKMAMDIRLVKANDDLATIAFDFGTDSKEYKKANEEWLETFKIVAAERGEPVIGWENPFDHIMEAIHSNEKPEIIRAAMSEFKILVDALESIGYINLNRWKADYGECVAAMSK
jgi:hypothetical protein